MPGASDPTTIQLRATAGDVLMRYAIVTLTAFLLTGTAVAWQVVEYKSGIIWPEPPVIDPGEPGKPPSDATVLFGGDHLDGWRGGDRWVIEDGVATAAGGSISTKQKF